MGDVMKYARKDASGRWIDVHIVPSDLFSDLADLERKTGVTGFLEVDDGVENGATDDGNGGYTNPTPITTPKQDIVFDSADWKEYAYGILGTIAAPTGTIDEKLQAGLRRYGKILKDARASTDDGTIAALDQYGDASNFRKDKVAVFLGILNADGKIVTDLELGAIITYWPKV